MRLAGPLVGAACGAAASLLLATLLKNLAFFVVMAPGGVALGALLGWTASKLRRQRLGKSIPLGVACAFANGVVSGLLDVVLGDFAGVHAGAHLRDGVAVGLVGDVVLWMVLIPIGVVAAALCVAATRRSTPSAA